MLGASRVGLDGGPRRRPAASGILPCGLHPASRPFRQIALQSPFGQWIARIAYWNKRAVYGLLFKASAKTVMTIAVDLKRLGARVGMTSVLHTWGSALTHHPHIHMIVPGGGLSPDGARWATCKPGFFLHVRGLSRLFRRLFIEGLLALHRAGELAFFGDLAKEGKR
jgi:hypothetical protein